MEEEISLLEIWEILKKRRKIILQITGSLILLALLISLLLPKKYQAVTTLLPNDAGKTNNYTQIAELAGLDIGTSAAAIDYESVLKSRNLAAKAVADHQLYPQEKTKQKKIDALLKAIKVEKDIKSALITFTYIDKDPKRAALVTNDYARYLNDYLLNSSIQKAMQNKEFLAGRIKKTKAELQQAEEQLKAFQEKNQLLTAKATGVVESKLKLEEEQQRTAAELAALQASQGEVKKQLPREIKTNLNNRNIESLKQTLSGLEVTLAGLQKKYSDNHPDVMAKKASIDTAREKLREEMESVFKQESNTENTVYQGLHGSLVNNEIQILALEARKKVLDQYFTQIKTMENALPQAGLESARLSRNVELKNQLYLMLEKQYEQAKIAETKDLPMVQVLDQAYVPEKKCFPKIKLNMVLTGTVGLILSCLIIFFQEAIQTVKKEGIQQ